jgi:hypothetical protein
MNEKLIMGSAFCREPGFTCFHSRLAPWEEFLSRAPSQRPKRSSEVDEMSREDILESCIRRGDGQMQQDSLSSKFATVTLPPPYSAYDLLNLQSIPKKRSLEEPKTSGRRAPKECGNKKKTFHSGAQPPDTFLAPKHLPRSDHRVRHSSADRRMRPRY